MIILNLLIAFVLVLLWTLQIYILHRLAHIKHPLNFLYHIHISHHKINYMKEENRQFKWYYFFFYFGGILETVDVLVTITIPAIIVYFIYPPVGIYILIFHYLYEVFFSEGVLDHNPAIKGRITSIFAWGDYHLGHHKNWNCNYGLLLTCWDHLFNTVKSPAKSIKPKVYMNLKNTPVLQ